MRFGHGSDSRDSVGGLDGGGHNGTGATVCRLALFARQFLLQSTFTYLCPRTGPLQITLQSPLARPSVHPCTTAAASAAVSSTHNLAVLGRCGCTSAKEPAPGSRTCRASTPYQHTSAARHLLLTMVLILRKSSTIAGPGLGSRISRSSTTSSNNTVFLHAPTASPGAVSDMSILPASWAIRSAARSIQSDIRCFASLTPLPSTRSLWVLPVAKKVDVRAGFTNVCIAVFGRVYPAVISPCWRNIYCGLARERAVETPLEHNLHVCSATALIAYLVSQLGDKAPTTRDVLLIYFGINQCKLILPYM